jgi:hypothetical protein
MYTKDDYKIEIKKFISNRDYDPTLIAKLTYEIYVDHAREINRELREKLLDVANMEMGPEFELTENEFKDFLDKL